MNPTTKPNVIVMAEDDADDRLLVKDALKECEWDADIRFVENGEELLEYCFSVRPQTRFCVGIADSCLRHGDRHCRRQSCQSLDCLIISTEFAEDLSPKV